MNRDLDFRRAEPDATPAAQTAYRRIIDHLAATVDFPHWHTENHPTPEEVAEWITAGDLFLAMSGTDTESGREGAVAGVVVLNHDAVDVRPEPAWSIDAAPDDVLAIHALGVVPEFLGTGVARFLIDASLRTAGELGCRTVRLDTYVENVAARTLYTRFGFTDLGAHTVRHEGTDLSEFHLFEYVL